MDECLELSIAIVVFALFALCAVVFFVVLPTVIITFVPREVLLWLVGKYILLISGSAVFLATATLWLLLCDATRWLLGAPAGSDIERRTTSTTAAPEKAGARPAPGDTTADATASKTATAPDGFFGDLTPTVTGKIVALAITATLVLGDLWLFGNVSRTKPVRENIAAALMHELAGLEVVCVLSSIMCVFAAGAQACGFFVGMENEEKSRRRRLRKKRIAEARKQSQEMV